MLAIDDYRGVTETTVGAVEDKCFLEVAGSGYGTRVVLGVARGAILGGRNSFRCCGAKVTGLVVPVEDCAISLRSCEMCMQENCQRCESGGLHCGVAL